MQQLEAHEKSLAKIFCGDYDFHVPHYQRPYAWREDETAELLSDLTEALERDQDEPYFLGSVVLIKQPVTPQASVIDGQQRLTTLTVLFSVLAELAEGEEKTLLRSLIFEPGNPLLGLAPKPRLELRPKDKAFFRKYIQEAGQLGELLTLGTNSLANDAQRRIRDNARYLHDRLSTWSAQDRLALGQLLAARTYLVVVSTPDLASAHRIFRVMNARGLDLSPADIFKAEVIGQITETLREDYARKWEDAEEDLGRDEFADLFLHIRMVFGKRRTRSELLKEFPEQVLSHFRPHQMERFVDDELIPFTRAAREIRDAAYSADDADAAYTVNAWFRRLGQLDNSDWRPAALWALRNHRGEPAWLDAFFEKLERLAASMFIRRVYTTPRVDRYARLLTELEKGDLLSCPSLALTPGEAADTRARLDGDIYLDTRVRRYVLLRLDELLSADGGAVYQRKLITIEHVLPQNPAADSGWRMLFTDTQREHWTHKLANLALLNRVKNTAAANHEFQQKKDSYFTGKTGTTTFALTTQILKTSEWTPETLERRQADLLGVLAEQWQLDAAPA